MGESILAQAKNFTRMFELESEIFRLEGKSREIRSVNFNLTDCEVHVVLWNGKKKDFSMKEWGEIK